MISAPTVEFDAAVHTKFQFIATLFVGADDHIGPNRPDSWADVVIGPYGVYYTNGSLNRVKKLPVTDGELLQFVKE